jgi:hypothetical protein
MITMQMRRTGSFPARASISSRGEEHGARSSLPGLGNLCGKSFSPQSARGSTENEARKQSGVGIQPLLNAGDQLLGRTRFHKEAYAQALIFRFGFRETGNNYDRDAGVQGPKLTNKGRAAVTRQDVVRDDNAETGGRRWFLEKCQSFLGSGCTANNEPAVAKHSFAHVQLRRIIVNQQNLEHRQQLPV